MEFNGPGTSLFQGSDLNEFDNNAQREEEEEAIEEQRRRDIELKNILENAFNDVSFDNEDCSGINLSFNHTNSNCNSKSSGMPNACIMNNSHSSVPEFGNQYGEEERQDFQTPIRHSRNIRTKTIDFNNQYETDNFPDQFRMKQQNGSLHDIVDASGGGGDAGVSLHYNHCIRSNSLGEHNSIQKGLSPINEGNVSLNKHYQNADYNSIEQLQILYEVRVREVHRLTELVDTMRNEHEIEKGELKRQLALAAAERERYKMSQNELESLLISSKEETENLKRESETLKKAINELEESKEGLLIDLETSRATINDLERKLLAIEKGRKDKTVLMQYEANIQEIKEKHAITVKNITEELDRCKMNLEMTNKENDELKLKVINLSQINDENLAKKSEIIHRLSKQIEESQEQCEKLMKNTFTEENVKLQMEMKVLKEENNVLTSKIQTLEKELASQEMELKQYECLSNFSAFDTREPTDQSIDKEGDYSEINRKLREELFRALNSQKARRQEIQCLQALITKKEEQIHSLAEKERQFLAEAAKFREDIGEHITELKKYETLTSIKETENRKLKELLDSTKNELEDALKVAHKKRQETEEENRLIREELENLKDNLDNNTLSKYNEEYLRFHNDGLERTRHEVEERFRLELMGKDMEIEGLKKEVEEVKNLYVEVYNEKENLLNQMDKEKSFCNRSGVDVEEVRNLQKELEKSRQRILELDLTLRQQYQQEVEKLKGNIKSLSLDLEKMRREKDHDFSEKSKILTENELLKSELEQITAEKNLYFLNSETLKKEIDRLKRDIDMLRENSDQERQEEEQEEDIRTGYEIKIQRLNKEIESMLKRSVSTDSKYTSPMKQVTKSVRNVGIQRSPVPVQSACTSPLYKSSTQESCTSPICVRDVKLSPLRASNRDVSVSTDPDVKNLTKRDVIRMMEKLGAQHEEEMNALENRYKTELMRLEKKWQGEVDSIKDRIKVEMMRMHVEELQELQEKHRIEMKNRVEQEKKEAVVALITEWTCEVQSLKQSQAEALALAEKMKLKYKTAKNIALRYKSYFASKAEQMKEEWRKVEEGYENALKELEKNVHMLVDVREDEVKTKVQSITKVYEHKINKMRKKLEKYEDLLKSETKDVEVGGESSKNSAVSGKEPDRLVVPNTHLRRAKKSERSRKEDGDSSPQESGKRSSKETQLKKLFLNESDDADSPRKSGK